MTHQRLLVEATGASSSFKKKKEGSNVQKGNDGLLLMRRLRQLIVAAEGLL